MDLRTDPYHPSDLEPVLQVLNASLPRDPLSAARFTRQVLLDPNFEPEGARVARSADTVLGFCLALARRVPLENAPPDADRGYVTLVAVLPEHRRRGIGGRLLGEAEAYLRSRERTAVWVSPYAPGYFLPGVDVEAYAGGLEFFRTRGYREVYRPLAMEVSLWDWSPPGWLSTREAALRGEGVRFERYRPHLTLPLLEFARQEFPGDWVRVVREAMTRILAGESSGRLVMALEGERVVGFSHHEGERFGPIGVAADQRGRGLGHVLMFHTLASIREQGMRVAWFLWSDDRTARRLYDAAGFREVRRFAVLRKEIGPNRA